MDPSADDARTDHARPDYTDESVHLASHHDADHAHHADRRWRARHPAATLTLFGDGPERPALERLAAGLGLGTCILGCFDEAKVKALLGIPADSVLRVLVTLGHPKEAAPPRDKKRLALDSVAQFIE